MSTSSSSVLHLRTVDPGHTGSIHTIRLNSSGTYTLSGGQDRKIQLTNIDTGARVKSYQLHAYEVVGLCIASDSSMFASCGGDRAVYLWDVSSGNTLRRFSGHLSRVNCVVFNDNETVLASASYDGTVKLWDLKSGYHNRGSEDKWENSTSAKPIMTLSQATDSVSSVDIHDSKIVTASVDGKLRVYDIRMGQLITDPVTSGTPLTSVMISQDGDTALVGSLDSSVRLMDLESGMALQVYKGHLNDTFRLYSSFCGNDESIVSGSEDGNLYMWNLMEGDEYAEKIDVTAHGNKNYKGTKPKQKTPVAFDVFTQEDGVVKIAAGTADKIEVYSVMS